MVQWIGCAWGSCLLEYIDFKELFKGRNRKQVWSSSRCGAGLGFAKSPRLGNWNSSHPWLLRSSARRWFQVSPLPRLAMDNLPLLFAFLTSCFLSRQIQGAEIAAVPREPTCSLRTNTRGVPFLQPGAPTCLSAAPEALNFKPPSHSNFATYSPEDRLLRLQQAVDDLLKCAVQLRATKALSLPPSFFSQTSFVISFCD